MRMARSLILLAVLMLVASAFAQALPDGSLPQPWTSGDVLGASSAAQASLGMLPWGQGLLDAARLGLADLAMGLVLPLRFDDRSSPVADSVGWAGARFGRTAAAGRPKAAWWRLRLAS